MGCHKESDEKKIVSRDWFALGCLAQLCTKTRSGGKL